MNADETNDLVRENAIVIGVIAAIVAFAGWMMTGVPL